MGTDTLVTSSTSGLMSTTTLTNRSIWPAALLATHLNWPLSARLIRFRLNTPVSLFTEYLSVPSLKSRWSGMCIQVTFGSGLPLAAHLTLAISPSITSSWDTWSGANVGGMWTYICAHDRGTIIILKILWIYQEHYSGPDEAPSSFFKNSVQLSPTHQPSMQKYIFCYWFDPATYPCITFMGSYIIFAIPCVGVAKIWLVLITY